VCEVTDTPRRISDGCAVRCKTMTNHHDSPTLAPRPTECFRYGESAPRRKRPDNGVATMGRGWWFFATLEINSRERGRRPP
jgi:hypothetical protein